MHKRKTAGLQRRWLRTGASLLFTLVALAVVLFSATIGVYYHNGMAKGLETRAKSTTDFFANYISQSYNDYFQSCVNFAQSFEDSDVLELQFLSVSGKLVASSYGPWTGQVSVSPDVHGAIDRKTISVYTGRNEGTGELIMAVSSPMLYQNGEVIGVLRFVTGMRGMVRQLLLVSLIALFIGAAFCGIVLLSNAYFIRSIIEPVRQITETSKRIAAGSYGSKIPKRYDDEIGELADTINDMSVKIGQAEKMQTEFVSSVSHELRTPLTAISGWSETLLSSENFDPEETRRGVNVILNETHRLTEMVEELLEFTRMQEGRFTLNVASCDLRADLEDTIFMYGSRLKRDGIVLEYEDNDDDLSEIRCDAYRIRQVLLNLLDNAAKHGGEGGRIDVSLARHGQTAVIAVRDYGPGIPEEELPRVRMKFYKGRSKARGSGIGLSVCEEIVTMHGGTMELKNAEGGGLRVVVTIPTGEE